MPGVQLLIASLLLIIDGIHVGFASRATWTGGKVAVRQNIGAGKQQAVARRGADCARCPVLDGHQGRHVCIEGECFDVIESEHQPATSRLHSYVTIVEDGSGPVGCSEKCTASVGCSTCVCVANVCYKRVAHKYPRRLQTQNRAGQSALTEAREDVTAASATISPESKEIDPSTVPLLRFGMRLTKLISSCFQCKCPMCTCFRNSCFSMGP